jgi:hypothetical protein
VPQVATALTREDVVGRWQMRWGIGRLRYRIAAGLYAVGTPGADSPVLVTANYKLTFDALRRQLGSLDAWLLVLDTKGINVWCAAGKGTFGTDELVRRIGESGLDKIVGHRTLIVPQLGAVGVAAHKVTRETGFRVVYGPVRAADLKAFLAAGMAATPAMRRVTFSTPERLILTPVELTGNLKTALWLLPLLWLLGGFGPGIFSLHAALARGDAVVAAALAALVTGAVLAPTLLPWLPGRAFAAKGAALGGAVALLAILLAWGRLGSLNALALLLALPAAASYLTMKFTGSTPYTSPSGVEKEMRRAIPLQALALMVAAATWFAAAF